MCPWSERVRQESRGGAVVLRVCSGGHSALGSVVGVWLREENFDGVVKDNSFFCQDRGGLMHEQEAFLYTSHYRGVTYPSHPFEVREMSRVLSPHHIQVREPQRDSNLPFGLRQITECKTRDVESCWLG